MLLRFELDSSLPIRTTGSARAHPKRARSISTRKKRISNFLMKTIFVVEGASSPPNRPACRALPSKACLPGHAKSARQSLTSQKKLTMIDGCVDKSLRWSIFLVGSAAKVWNLSSYQLCLFPNFASLSVFTPLDDLLRLIFASNFVLFPGLIQ